MSSEIETKKEFCSKSLGIASSLELRIAKTMTGNSKTSVYHNQESHKFKRGE